MTMFKHKKTGEILKVVTPSLIDSYRKNKDYEIFEQKVNKTEKNETPKKDKE